MPYLPQEKPTYLMGVGTPENILEAVERGVDFFDCVLPARNGRHAHVYTNRGKLNLLNAKYELDDTPIDETCGCPVCRRYSKAYIRHLFKAREMLAMRLAVMHNLYFFNTMMEEIRQALDEERFPAYKKAKLELCWKLPLCWLSFMVLEDTKEAAIREISLLVQPSCGLYELY